MGIFDKLKSTAQQAVNSAAQSAGEPAGNQYDPPPPAAPWGSTYDKKALAGSKCFFFMGDAVRGAAADPARAAIPGRILS